MHEPLRGDITASGSYCMYSKLVATPVRFVANAAVTAAEKLISMLKRPNSPRRSLRLMHLIEALQPLHPFECLSPNLSSVCMRATRARRVYFMRARQHKPAQPFLSNAAHILVEQLHAFHNAILQLNHMRERHAMLASVNAHCHGKNIMPASSAATRSPKRLQVDETNHMNYALQELLVLLHVMPARCRSYGTMLQRRFETFGGCPSNVPVRHG